MLIEVIFLILIVCLFILLLNGTQKPAGTPPGSVGWPIIGHFLRNKPMSVFMKEFHEKYGDIFWLKLGSRKFVIISDPDIIKEAFNHPAITGRVGMYTNCLFRNGNSKNGILFNDGTAWRNVRRFALKQMRDGGMGKSSMEGIIAREAESLIEDFGKYVGKTTTVPWSLNAAIFNVTWRLVADQRFEIGDEQLNKLHKCLAESIDSSQGILMAFNMMPWLIKVVPEFVKQHLLGKRLFDEQVKTMEKELLKTIDEHRTTIDEDNPRDLIDFYIIELSKVLKDPDNASEAYSTFSEKELIYLTFDLFLAGSETTSSTIRWFLLFMAKHPDIQRRVQEEINRVIPNDKVATMSDRSSLPYLDAAIHETMRCRTLLPLALFHRVTETTQLAGYIIPEDTIVAANLDAVHTNAKLWEKPYDFYPEHFLNSDMTFNTKKTGFLAFSTGRRVCVGESLARTELFIFLSGIMQKFSFRAPEGVVLHTEQLTDQPLISIPKNYKIIIEKI